MNVNDIDGFESTNTIMTVVDWLPTNACKVNNFSVEATKSYTCIVLELTFFPSDNWCKLFLKGYNDGSNIEKIDIYYINQKPCPDGLIKLMVHVKVIQFSYHSILHVTLMIKH